MVFVSAAVENVLLQQRNGKPLNSEYNRNQLSAAYATDGDTVMTPVMCGFWLQAMVMDRNSNAFQELLYVAGRTQAVYEDRGMEPHVAIAGSLRMKLQNPTLFNIMTAR